MTSSPRARRTVAAARRALRERPLEGNRSPARGSARDLLGDQPVHALVERLRRLRSATWRRVCLYGHASNWSAVVLSPTCRAWRETDLWSDLSEVPEALRRRFRRPTASTSAAARCAGVRRIATGNGAAYYVAHALWLASLEGPGGPPIVAVPGGLVAGGRFPGGRATAARRLVVGRVPRRRRRSSRARRGRSRASPPRPTRRSALADAAPCRPCSTSAPSPTPRRSRRRRGGARGVGARDRRRGLRPRSPTRRRPRARGRRRRVCLEEDARTRCRPPPSCSAAARPGRRRSRPR